MKTKRFQTVITIILAIAFAASLGASTSIPGSGFINPPVKEAPNLEIASAYAVEFNFEEEAYINDIPFNTECVSKNCLYQKALLEIYMLDAEQYINDIPFDTELIKAQNKNVSIMQLDFEFEEESYIDDIPFDTFTLAHKYNQDEFAFNK